MKNTPIITVTCVRDLPMLDLQAQGINLYLSPDCPVYIVVNEDDPSKWDEVFNTKIRHYYNNHNLTVLYKQDFSSYWAQWIPSRNNPWAVGWETQQILKLAIATLIDHPNYLILDSQNFLITKWNPSKYACEDGRISARPGHFVMPMEIWDDYSKSLNITVAPPTEETVSMCTPIFFHTGLVKSLIDHIGGVHEFTNWFKNASRIKSEFILYVLWAEKQGGIDLYHKMITVPEDWGNPMLRDCRTKEEFDAFINFVGVVPNHAWVSANHRAWGNMTPEQYTQLTQKLAEYKLTPNFDDYRNTYVDLKF